MTSAMVRLFPPRTPAAVLIAVWGMLGVVALLVSAIVRLTPLAVEPLTTGMTPLQWALYVGWSLFNLYAEGYKGFQKAFVPRAVARAFYVARYPRPLHVVLAPLFCMGLFYATRKRLILSWGLVIGVTALVTLVRGLDQPWRGIVDAGVVLGLSYGTVALLVTFFGVMAGRPITVSAQAPDGAPQ
ncbi:hypothetical protein [Nannocystis bainbridge]|uniref:Uncharacterized protein n=1 Tax=Nannocystis bainbridge TaxID=2995303 RepID=A0ABT5E0N6_9BACT|nr:hypothetical protein [Nannocystis bainbridge]MDC0719404.1 hypothetical protein [Nannocystis bainbridge]